MMSLRVARIERNRPAKLAFSSGPIVIEVVLEEPQRGVSLRRGVVQLQRLLDCGLRLWNGHGRSEVETLAVRVGVSQAGVGRGELRIQLYCPLELFDRFVDSLFAQLVQEIAAFEIRFVRFGTDGT